MTNGLYPARPRVMTAIHHKDAQKLAQATSTYAAMCEYKEAQRLASYVYLCSLETP